MTKALGVNSSAILRNSEVLMTDFQIVSMFSQGLPIEVIAKQANLTIEKTEEVIQSRVKCVNCTQK